MYMHVCMLMYLLVAKLSTVYCHASVVLALCVSVRACVHN